MDIIQLRNRLLHLSDAFQTQKGAALFLCHCRAFQHALMRLVISLIKLPHHDEPDLHSGWRYFRLSTLSVWADGVSTAQGQHISAKALVGAISTEPYVSLSDLWPHAFLSNGFAAIEHNEQHFQSQEHDGDGNSIVQTKATVILLRDSTLATG
jgi:hypothetical protein